MISPPNLKACLPRKIETCSKICKLPSGPLYLGQLPTQLESGTIQLIDLDERKAESPRIGHASVDAVGERIHGGVI